MILTSPTTQPYSCAQPELIACANRENLSIMSDHSSADANGRLEPLADLFKLLSDRTRLRILNLLTQGERNVSSLCEEMKLPQPTVSHHLGLLRMRNIIVNRRSGKQVFYGLD